MRQLQLFTNAQLAVMRDRTKASNYSAEADAFRREHERHRAWGLTQRHARKLRRLRDGTPDGQAPSVIRQHRDDQRSDPSRSRPPRPGSREWVQDQASVESPTSPDPSPRPVTPVPVPVPVPEPEPEPVPEPEPAGRHRPGPAGKTPPTPARQAPPAPTAEAPPAAALPSPPAPAAGTLPDPAGNPSARLGWVRPAKSMRPNRRGNGRDCSGPSRNPGRHRGEPSRAHAFTRGAETPLTAHLQQVAPAKPKSYHERAPPRLSDSSMNPG